MLIIQAFRQSGITYLRKVRVKTHSGRKRYNVLGALNFITKKMTTVTNDTYITALEICELLKKAAIEYAGTPIYLILDNAHQKCKIVEQVAGQLGIHLNIHTVLQP